MISARELVRKRIRGCIVAHVRGVKKGAHFNWVVGQANKAMERKYVTKEEVLNFILEIETSRTYLPTIPVFLKKKRLERLRQALENKF